MAKSQKGVKAPTKAQVVELLKVANATIKEHEHNLVGTLRAHGIKVKALESKVTEHKTQVRAMRTQRNDKIEANGALTTKNNALTELSVVQKARMKKLESTIKNQDSILVDVSQARDRANQNSATYLSANKGLSGAKEKLQANIVAFVALNWWYRLVLTRDSLRSYLNHGSL